MKSNQAYTNIEVINADPTGVGKVWMPNGETDGELQTSTPVNEQGHDYEEVQKPSKKWIYQEVLQPHPE